MDTYKVGIIERQIMKIYIKRINLILLCVAFTFIVTSCGKQGVTSLLGEEGDRELNIESENNDNNNNNIIWEDGNYSVNITMEGGTGKAYIQSPVDIVVSDGQMDAIFIWSSKNYDYMIVDNVKYLNENNGGESTFTVPIKNISEPLNVIGDTVAMSTPHEIEYTIYFEVEE